MRILVTGAAGFIGSHLLDELKKEKKHQIFAADDLSGGYRHNIPAGVTFKKIDLRNKKAVERYIQLIKPELLFYLAADATEGRSQFTPISAIERNLLAYTYTLIPSIKYGLKKVILTSSMSVYGSQEPPFSETMLRKPDDLYGVAKSAMEEVTEILSTVHGFSYVILRPHNVYGPRQNMADPYRNVIAIFINCLLNKKPYYIYGDGNQKRAFTHIKDLAPYILQSAFLKKCEGEKINLGPREEMTINTISKLILKHFFNGKTIPARLSPKHIPSRPMEVRLAYCTNDKAISLLGYKNSVAIEDGIRETVEWAKQFGPQEFRYLDEGLELETKDVPIIWKKHLI